MPEYIYRAADAAGKMLDGTVEAAGREAALRQLRAKGLTPIRLEESDGAQPATDRLIAHKPASKAASSGFAARRAPDHADIHRLTAELAVMLRAGLPLDRALRVLIDMTEKPSMVTLLQDLLKAVKGGKGLSQALQPHQTLFGDFYISMLRSGEAGGNLGEVLARLAEHLERVKAMRESVISALIYPAILVTVACVSVVLMLGFVVPQFETLFADMGDALPLPTRIIIGLGDVVAAWGWLIALAATAGVWFGRRWLSTPRGRQWLDGRLLRMPILGEVLRKYELTRFSRTMGTLLGNGVPIVSALKIASDTLGNLPLRAAMSNVPGAIKQGGRLADALQHTGLFTPLALNMVRLGEETGRLDAMLLELSRVHDAEVQAGVKRALTMLEPVLILLLGAVIAAIIVSILMGILSVNDLAL